VRMLESDFSQRVWSRWKEGRWKATAGGSGMLCSCCEGSKPERKEEGGLEENVTEQTRVQARDM